jgi:hypothetical protein
MIVAKKRYPTDPRKQYLYSLGYLVGIITEVAAADNYAEHQLYHILKQLKKRGE